MNNIKEKKSAFTLIELIIVIAIIAILAAAIFVAIDPARRLHEARNARRSSDVATILEAVKKHQVDNGGDLYASISALGDNLPHQIGTNGASGCGLTACNDGVTLEGDCLDLSALPANYMATVPDDPQAVAPGSLTRYYLTVGTLNEITIGSCDEEAEGAGGTGAAPVIELTR